MDGVCLSEMGLGQIRGLSVKLAEKKPRQRWKRAPSLPTHPGLLAHMLSIMSERSEEDVEMESKSILTGMLYQFCNQSS